MEHAVIPPPPSLSLFQEHALHVPGQLKLVVSVAGVSLLSNDVVLWDGRVDECVGVCSLASSTLANSAAMMVG